MATGNMGRKGKGGEKVGDGSATGSSRSALAALKDVL